MLSGSCVHVVSCISSSPLYSDIDAAAQHKDDQPSATIYDQGALAHTVQLRILCKYMTCCAAWYD